MVCIAADERGAAGLAEGVVRDENCKKVSHAAKRTAFFGKSLILF